MYILKMQYNFEKLFLVFKIIAFEVVAGFSLIYEQNTCGRQSMIQRYVFQLNLSWMNGKLG